MTTRVLTTPYGRPALDVLRSVVSVAKHDDPMAPVTVVVPNNIAGVVARRDLAQGLDSQRPGISGIHVTTLSRLAEQLAAPALHARRPVTQSVVAAAWRQALDTTPGVFAKVKDHPATIRALGSAHRELRDLTPTGRDRARRATGLGQDLLRLHEEVVELLSDAWYDTTDLLHAAARIASSEPGRLTEHGSLVLYLPQHLSQAEAALARALTATDGVTVVLGMTGVKRADAGVRRTLEKLNLSAPAELPDPPVATRILHASDADDEVRCVVREVAAALTRTPAHRVAVLYGSQQPYARQLHEHLAAAGLTVNGPATRAVHERAIARGLLAVLKLGISQMPRGETFIALTEAPAYDFTGHHVPVARWERVSRRAGIVGQGDWHRKLDTFVADQGKVITDQEKSDDPWHSKIDAARREITTAEDLRTFIHTLQERLGAGGRTTTWEELSSWALMLFHDLYGAADTWRSLPAEEQYAAVVVEASLRGLPSLAGFGTHADLALLIEVLSLELESALPRVGRYGEGVFIGPVSAAIGLDLDEIFILGLSEDSFPGRLHEDALLNDALREATAGELEPVRDRLDTKHRHLLAAFSAAPRVTASFPRGDLRKSTRGLPSRFLLPSLRAITGNKELAATEWDQPDKHLRSTDDLLVGSPSFAYGVLTTPAPATSQEWQVRATSADVPLEEPAASVLDSGRALADARASDAFTRFDGNLTEVTGLPDYAHSDRAVSPTALEAYANCPHGYFVRRLLGVEPVEQPEEIIQISAADIGSLIHASMDALITEAQEDLTLPSYGEPWSSAHRARLQEIVTDRAADLVEHGLTGHHRLWEPELAAIRIVLSRMLDDDDAFRARRDAEVVGSELVFGLDGTDPVAVPLADGTVLMRGSADKVDRTRDGVLIVTDIKSGKADSFKVLEEDPVAAGTKLQLPVYAHAARQSVTDKPVTGVEAMYWFVRRDAGKRIALDLDEDLERKYAEALGTLVSGIAVGLFPGRPAKQQPYGFVECEYCTPGGLGHKEARGRYERKRGDVALIELMGLIDPEALAEQTTAIGVVQQ